MSGICGIVQLEDAPSTLQVLLDMTSFMGFRGPDAQATWVDGAVGFGHTLLRTTDDLRTEQQPASLEGRVWIVADARIDGQAELKSALAARGRSGLADALDHELILHAYHAWGDSCVEYLIGDFAFAIWDTSKQRLFCARDHFGVKPFFYSLLAEGLAFSNTLDCLRRHPGISDALNELAIADFLVFDQNQEAGTTVFADILRLPPAHCLVWSAVGLDLRKYWSLPTNLGVRYRPANDYVERFTELLGLAVSDRLRTSRVGVEMSGGLDSTSIAATARAVLGRRRQPFDLRVHTIVYDTLIPEEERKFASLAAEHFGMPIHFLVADAYEFYERCDEPELRFPEPLHDPDAAIYCDAIKQAVPYCRVMLTGWDGEAILTESPKPYFRDLWKQGRYVLALAGIVQYALMERRLIPLGLLEKLGLRPRGEPAPSQPYPVWLNPEFEERLQLRARWQRINAESPPSHPIRPYAYRIFDYVQRLSNFFDRYDPGLTGQPLEYSHPLFDLRVLEYCLTLPPSPWCVRKKILREAMKGLMPDAVRLRPKTYQPGFPHLERLRKPGSRWVDEFRPDPQLEQYVAYASIPDVCSDPDSDASWFNLRPLSLNFWLKSMRRMKPTSNGTGDSP